MTTDSNNSKPSNMGKVNKKSKNSEGPPAGSEGWSMERIANLLFRYWKYLIPVLASIFALTLYKGSNNPITNLINAEDKTLKNAIFGEQPYLFYCDRNVPGSNSQGSTALQGLPGLFTHLNTIKNTGEMGFAVVNCSQKLPSGKTLLERFALKSTIKPIIWGNAPWLLKPIQFLPKHMKDVTTMNKYVDDLLLSPKSIALKSDKQFHKVCEFAKSSTQDDRDITPTCVVMIKGEKYQQHTKIQSELERRLILEYPKTRFVMIDGKHHRLSFEDVEEMPYDQFGLKVHAIRNGTHYMSMVNPITWDYLNTFVSNAVSSPLYGFNEHQDDDLVRMLKPSIIAKKHAKKRIMEEKKKRKTESGNKNSKPSSAKTTSDSTNAKPQKPRVVEDKKKSANENNKKKNEEVEEVDEEEFDDDEEDELDLDNKDENKSSKETEAEQEELDPEALRQERLERERRRREEMEQQAKSHVFESNEGEDNDSDSDDEEDEDDGVIEL